MSYTYPMWFKFKDSDLVIKFNSLHGGEVIVSDNINNIGDIRNPINESEVGWIEHTDITFWEDVTNSFNPLNFGINTNEAPKCQHEISFDEECGECIKLLNKHPLKNPNSDYYELWEDVEAIDIIEGNLTKEELIGACKFNILKYQLRIGKKDNVEKELQKIKTYQDYLKYLKA